MDRMFGRSLDGSRVPPPDLLALGDPQQGQQGPLVVRGGKATFSFSAAAISCGGVTRGLNMHL